MAEKAIKTRRNDSDGSAHSAFEPLLPNGTRRIPAGWKKTHSALLALLLCHPESSRSQTPEGASKKTQSVLCSDWRSSHPFNSDAPNVLSFIIMWLIINKPPPPELGYTITAKDLDEEKKAAISKIQKVLETPAPEPEKSVSPADTTSTQPAASTATLSSFLAGPLPRSTSAIPVINLDPSPGSSSSSSSSSSAAPAVANSLLEALKMKISVPASSTSAANTTTVSVSAIPAPAVTFNLNTSTTAPTMPPASQSQPSSAGVMGLPSVLNQVLAQVSKVPTSIPAAFMTGPTLFGQSSQISTTSAPSASTTVTTAAAPAPASSSQPVSNTNPLLTAGFKPIFAATTTTSSAAASSESKPLDQTFKPIFPQPSSISATSTASTLSASSTTSGFGLTTSSSTVAPPSFSGFNNTSAGPASLGAVSTTQPAVKSEIKSLFGSWSTPSTTSSSSASVQPPSSGSTFQFGAAATTTAATTAAPATATTTSNTTGFSFGATQPDPQAPKVFSFGQTTSIQNTTSASFGGFAMANTVSTAAPTSTTQSTFTFGKPAFEATAAQPTFSSSSAPSKPFTFGAGGASTPAAGAAPAPASFTFGAPAATATTAAPSFGTPAKPAFGASSTGFAFGTNAAPSAAPSFGTATQTQSSSSASFAFGSAAPQSAPSGSAQPATGGFNFGASMPCPQFGTPVSNSPAPQMGSFNFGAAAASDKPVFGTSTPSFGQGATPGPTPFGSPATPVQGFNAVPFAPTSSIRLPHPLLCFLPAQQQCVLAQSIGFADELEPPQLPEFMLPE
ncbi:hypothetical protein CRENBAI_020944 [Crenichthys baileyi]|uniref:Uncharacterized protein n=1 Tax=Crenichthys baileyi TaxID=28760 RepID=A0AAV9RQJ4_9TELE